MSPRIKSSAVRIVMTHAVAGVAWVALSDVIFIMVEGKNDHPVLVMGSISALLYLAITCFILYYLINLHYRRLQVSEQQYRSYFDDNPTPMWIYNRDTLRFLNVNDAALAHYGYSNEEFMEMTILDIHCKMEALKVRAAVQDFPSKYQNSGTWKHLRKDGSDVFAHITSHLITSINEERVMVMAKDITKRLQTEKQLQQANAELVKQNAILREISWSESHNVRRPLASILGLLELIRYTRDEKEKELCLNYIEISAAELDIMIHEISAQINDAVYLDSNFEIKNEGIKATSQLYN